MEIIAYRAVTDIPLSYIKNVYIAQTDYNYGPGMYFSLDHDYSLTITKTYEKWAFLTKYNITINNIISVNENESSNNTIIEYVSLVEELKLKNRKFKKIFKNVFDLDENFSSLSSAEQNKIFQKTKLINEELEKTLSTHPDFMRWKYLSQMITKWSQLMSADLSKTCDAILIENEDMLIVKNESIRLEVLEVKLFCPLNILKSLSNKFEISIYEGYLLIPPRLIEEISEELNKIYG